MSEYDKLCEYCHAEVSIFEGLTEYGKWWHERCYIHRTQKEIEGYKKKWINNKLTEGDKADLVDKYNLVQTLKSEHTEFKGFEPIADKECGARFTTEKTILSLPGGIPVLDSDGKPIIIETKTKSVSCRYIWMRPRVVRTKQTVKPKLIKSAEEILRLEGVK